MADFVFGLVEFGELQVMGVVTGMEMQFERNSWRLPLVIPAVVAAIVIAVAAIVVRSNNDGSAASVTATDRESEAQTDPVGSEPVGADDRLPAPVSSEAGGLTAKSGWDQAAVLSDLDWPEGLEVALSEAMDLPPDVARAALQDQMTATTEASTRSSDLGDSFGGVWVAESGRMTIGVTDRSLLETDSSSVVELVLVNYSEAELERVMERLDELAETDQQFLVGAQGWGVDPVANQVTVRTNHRDEVAAELERTGIDLKAIGFVDAPDWTPTASVAGGDYYGVKGGGSCSVGFAVQAGFITAGHCGNVGDVVTTQRGRRIGVFEQKGEATGDDAFVRLDSGNDAQPWVAANQRIPIHGYELAPVGATVCRMGATSGYHCGVVTNNNYTLRWQFGLARGNIVTTVCASPGDSGGPLVWGNQAQGVSSQTNNLCNDGDQSGTSVYAAARRALHKWDLWLETPDGPIAPPAVFDPPPDPNDPGDPNAPAPVTTTTTVPSPSTTVLPPTPGPSTRVVLYQDTLFGGVSWSVGSGVYDWPVVDGSPVGNDALSSIRVPSGFTIRVCEHGGGGGVCRSFSSSVADLGPMNDQVSYIEVTAGGPPPPTVPPPSTTVAPPSTVPPTTIPPTTTAPPVSSSSTVPVFPPSPPAPSGAVVLFSDWDFGGVSWSVGSGVYDWPVVDGSPVGNDAVSSIRVPSGFTVRVCEHGGGGGTCQSFSSSVSQLVALNDRVSFVEVTAGPPPPSGSVVLYRDTLFGGVSWSVGPGVYDWPVVDGSPVGNDAVSSIRVPSGFTIRVCEHGGGDGVCRSFTSSVLDLGSMNDQISYIEVTS